MLELDTSKAPFVITDIEGTKLTDTGKWIAKTSYLEITGTYALGQVETIQDDLDNPTQEATLANEQFTMSLNVECEVGVEIESDYYMYAYAQHDPEPYPPEVLRIICDKKIPAEPSLYFIAK